MTVTLPDTTGISVDLLKPYRASRADVVRQFERAYVEKLMNAAGGNVCEASRIAKMDRSYLHKMLKRHGLRR